MHVNAPAALGRNDRHGIARAVNPGQNKKTNRDREEFS